MSVEGTVKLKDRPHPPGLEFKRLTAECSRGVFSCGEGAIDKWFRQSALKHHQSLQARVVTAHVTGNPHPAGFFAMSMKLEQSASLEPNKGTLRSLFDEKGLFPTVRLNWVAVQRSMQRQGIGTVIMGAALDDFREVALRTGIYALTLTAIDEDRARFYEKLGFVRYGQSSPQPKMLLPAASVLS